MLKMRDDWSAEELKSFLYLGRCAYERGDYEFAYECILRIILKPRSFIETQHKHLNLEFEEIFNHLERLYYFNYEIEEIEKKNRKKL